MDRHKVDVLSTQGLTCTGSRIGRLAAVAIALMSLVWCSSALASECPSEQARRESNVNVATGEPYSMQLPDCRAYELVSPPDTGGTPAVSFDSASGAAPRVNVETGWDEVTPGGALYWFSRATPEGTGAVPDGRSLDVFVSRRTVGGWTTRDLTPFATIGENEFVAGAADGSAALILTQTSLLPEDQDNPFNGQGGVKSAFDVYRVSEGEAPLLVSHGSAPRTVPPDSGEGLEQFRVLSNAQLSAVAFVSSARLTGIEEAPGFEASAGFSDCYVWSDVGAGIAGLTNPDTGSTSSRNCELLGLMPDGRPIFKDLSGDADSGLIFVGNGSGFPHGKVQAVRLSAPGSAATSFDSISPDGGSAYVTTAYPLGNEERNGEANVYTVNVPAFPQNTLGVPGETGSENTVTCISCQVGGGGPAQFVGQSADGSHVFFEIAEGSGESPAHPYKGLWSWTRNSRTAARLIEATDVEQLIYSQNGQFAVGLTEQLAGNSNGTPDVYEFAAGQAPQLITSGGSSDVYRLTGFGEDSFRAPTAASVSNDGQRVVYDDKASGGSSIETVQEWTHGGTVQLSPIGATSSYYVLGTSGPELEDVFFTARDALVPADHNGGTQDIYDARVQGGFPAPSGPPNNNQTPNPIAPAITTYPQNLTAPSVSLAELAPDTSHPAGTTHKEPLTRAEKLARALKACEKEKPRAKRESCVHAANKKYRPRFRANKRKGGT